MTGAVEKVAARPTCAPEPHAWATTIRGGEPIQIPICMLCGEIDWDDLRRQADAIREAAIAALREDGWADSEICGTASPGFKVIGFPNLMHEGCLCVIAAGVKHEWHCCKDATRWRDTKSKALDAEEARRD